jgi:hypothetical protein
LSLYFSWAPSHEGVLWEWRYSSTHSLTSALHGGEWSASRPGRFTPTEIAPGTHWIGGWVGPRAVLDAVVKRNIPSPRRESKPRTPIVKPVAQCYTDRTIMAPFLHLNIHSCDNYIKIRHWHSFSNHPLSSFCSMICDLWNRGSVVI